MKIIEIDNLEPSSYNGLIICTMLPPDQSMHFGNGDKTGRFGLILPDWLVQTKGHRARVLCASTCCSM